MRITKKKIVGTVAVAAVVAMGAGSAFAFWTTSGSGSGTATVGTDAGFSIAGSISPLVYLDVPQTFDVTVTNSAAFPQHLSTLTFDIDAADAGCLETWFTKTQAVIPVGGVDIAAGGNAVFPVTLKLNNLPTTNQDACKNTGISISYLSS